MANKYIFHGGSDSHNPFPEVFTLGKTYKELETVGFRTILECDNNKKGNGVTNDYLKSNFRLVVEEPINTAMVGKREFDTGAYRNLDDNKLDYEAFLSPRVLEEFGKYMHEHRKLEDGTLRDADNWQKGIPEDVYMKSMWRHFHAVWSNVRGIKTKESQVENLCAMMFNVMGMLHEELKK